MKWVVDTQNDDSDSDGASLPQPKVISREALAAPDFNKDAFLTEHAGFRSLSEVQSAVREWEVKLHAELFELVNANFDDIVGAVDSVKAGEPSLATVRAELLKFERAADIHTESLKKGASALNAELQNNKCLTAREHEATQLQYMIDLLNELETAVPETSSEDVDSIVVLAKMCVAMLTVAIDFGDVKAVKVLHLSMESVYSELQAKLDEAVASSSPENARILLIEAREHVRECIQEYTETRSR